MIKISGRKSKEGGSDIDLDNALERALEEYKRSKEMEPPKVKKKEPKSKW